MPLDPLVPNELADRAQLLQEVLASSSDIVFIKSASGHYIAGNKAHADLCGVPEDEVIGKDDWELHGDDETVRYVVETDRQVLESGEPYQATGLPITFRGSERWFDILKSPLHDTDGRIVGVIGVARDITRLHQAEQRLAHNNTWLERLNAAIVGVVGSRQAELDFETLLEPAVAMVHANQAMLYLEGATGGVELVGSSGEGNAAEAMAAQVADAVWDSENSDPRVLDGYIGVPVALGDDRFGVLVFRDAPGDDEVTQLAQSIAGQLAMLNLQRHLVDTIKRQSLTDQLTGLGNRRHFNQELDRVMADATRNGQSVAVAFMDLDDFKAINDTHGHHEGDLVLEHVARCLRSVVREGDTAARLGGDEFGLIAPGVGPESLDDLCHRLHEAFDHPVRSLRGELLAVGVSIGAASGPAQGSDSNEVLTAADKAMYVAKRARKGAA